MPPPFEGITSSGNNKCIKIQVNAENSTGGQSGHSYSAENIFRGQSLNQDSELCLEDFNRIKQQYKSNRSLNLTVSFSFIKVWPIKLV